ncbi:aldehyde dehydrogenase [Phaffia rhodozyma]|uniref:Aldehyde dehydrogenase n=1 Tax=Phaffia rhodozyma TaxID=264483 RepID=A0A0F7SJ37_PHARH|nr:aldehyde dehydrogenase [Phaffia rhodozyma]
MSKTFTKKFDHTAFKGEVTINTGLFINGEFVDPVEGKTIETIDPTTGEVITAVSAGTAKDVEIAVNVAEKAFEEVWGEKVPGHERGKILMKLADLVEANADELAAIESLDNGKAFSIARSFDVPEAAACLRYYGGWADKDGGKVIEVDQSKMAYTRHEPIGVVGQIIPWNFPILMFAWKVGPALACGNTVVMKPSEMTPLTALRMVALMNEAGVPKGVFNLINGLGITVGAAIASHPRILKVAFTGSTLVGRNIMKAASETNLKNITLELGGKSPNIVFEDADLDQAASWSCFGIFFNHGQACCAGSRIYVQESIKEKFMEKFMAKVKALKVGNPFDDATFQGPQVSQAQYDRIMSYIQSGKDEGATLLAGGKRHGDKGYFIEPTVFADVKQNMKISKEEIFGPVVAIATFKDEADVIQMANKSEYGLASAVFSRDVSRAITVANRIQAGTVWVNCYNQLNSQVPFGGFKASGIGRELGEYALHNYTSIKSVHINLSGGNPL